MGCWIMTPPLLYCFPSSVLPSPLQYYKKGGGQEQLKALETEWQSLMETISEKEFDYLLLLQEIAKLNAASLAQGWGEQFERDARKYRDLLTELKSRALFDVRTGGRERERGREEKGGRREEGEQTSLADKRGRS